MHAQFKQFEPAFDRIARAVVGNVVGFMVLGIADVIAVGGDGAGPIVFFAVVAFVFALVMLVTGLQMIFQALDGAVNHITFEVAGAIENWGVEEE